MLQFGEERLERKRALVAGAQRVAKAWMACAAPATAIDLASVGRGVSYDHYNRNRGKQREVPRYWNSGRYQDSHRFENRIREQHGGNQSRSLCGTDADFAAGTVGLQLSDSGGPGFQFLTIIDTNKLSGKIIYVLRAVGSTDSQFTINIE